MARKKTKTAKSVVSTVKSVKKTTKSTKKSTPAHQKRQIELVDLERLVELDFVRTTEAAALNAYRGFGKGDPQLAHDAAVDALRGTLDLTSISGTVVYGEGLRQMPNSIQTGEKLGNWMPGSLKVDLCIVPIDGAETVASGHWGAMSILVAVSKEGTHSALAKLPCEYVEKIVYGPAVAAGPAQIHLNASVRDNLEIIATKLNKRIQDLIVAVLERDRHKELIGKIRKAGASVRLLNEGEIAASMAPCLPDTGIDVYMGVGGATETIVSAAALRCLGGDIVMRLAPQSEKEKKAVNKELGRDYFDCFYHAEDLAGGDNVVFCATGISDGSILRGIHITGSRATTSSVVMRARFQTVRKIMATHNLAKKTIRLRSAAAEARL